jgi:hypothetical protein
MFEFVLAGQEVGGCREFRLGFFFKGRQDIRVDFAFMNDFCQKIVVSGQTVFRNKRGQILGSSLAVGSRRVRRRESTCLDAFHRGLGNGVGIISDVVLDPVASLPHVVGPNLATILEVNHIRGGAHRCGGYKQQSTWQEEDDTCTH